MNGHWMLTRHKRRRLGGEDVPLTTEPPIVVVPLPLPPPPKRREEEPFMFELDSPPSSPTAQESKSWTFTLPEIAFPGVLAGSAWTETLPEALQVFLATFLTAREHVWRFRRVCRAWRDASYSRASWAPRLWNVSAKHLLLKELFPTKDNGHTGAIGIRDLHFYFDHAGQNVRFPPASFPGLQRLEIGKRKDRWTGVRVLLQSDQKVHMQQNCSGVLHMVPSSVRTLVVHVGTVSRPNTEYGGVYRSYGFGTTMVEVSPIVPTCRLTNVTELDAKLLYVPASEVIKRMPQLTKMAVARLTMPPGMTDEASAKLRLPDTLKTVAIHNPKSSIGTEAAMRRLFRLLGTTVIDLSVGGGYVHNDVLNAILDYMPLVRRLRFGNWREGGAISWALFGERAKQKLPHLTTVEFPFDGAWYAWDAFLHATRTLPNIVVHTSRKTSVDEERSADEDRVKGSSKRSAHVSVCECPPHVECQLHFS